MSGKKRIAVIGAGAAGCMAAIFAAGPDTEVVLIEATKEGGRKILISGGGRCNVLPAAVDVTRYVTDSSPNLMRKMVRAWPLAEQIAFFEGELGIPLVEESESVKLFPASHKARDVRDGLIEKARRKGITPLMDTRVTNIRPDHGRWRVERAVGDPMDFDAVVVATGGLSVPNTGSDGSGLRILAARCIRPTRR
jgi:predicted Rossmann fold flavoprotein